MAFCNLIKESHEVQREWLTQLSACRGDDSEGQSLAALLHDARGMTYRDCVKAVVDGSKAPADSDAAASDAIPNIVDMCSVGLDMSAQEVAGGDDGLEEVPATALAGCTEKETLAERTVTVKYGDHSFEVCDRAGGNCCAVLLCPELNQHKRSTAMSGVFDRGLVLRHLQLASMS